MAQYQREAHVTASTSFYGDFVCTKELLEKLNIAIAAIAEVDKVKKQLFYGRDIEGLRTISLPVADLNMSVAEQNIMHSLIGVGTEGGECLELLRDFLFGKFTGARGQFDQIKVMEELGGAMWYIPIGAQAMGVTMAEIADLNIAQLRKRYAGKFDAYEANNRDLAAEDKVMGEMTGTLSGAEKTIAVRELVPGPKVPIFAEMVNFTADEEKQRYSESLAAKKHIIITG